jgi:hypothetical protein
MVKMLLTKILRQPSEKNNALEDTSNIGVQSSSSSNLCNRYFQTIWSGGILLISVLNLNVTE